MTKQIDVQKGYIRSLVSGTSTLLLRVVLNIALIPLLIKLLGIERYGFYLFLINFSELLVMLDAGLTSGLVQRLSMFQANNQPEQTREQLSIALILYSVLAIGLMVIGSIISPWVLSFISVPKADIAEGSLLMSLVFIDSGITLFGFYFISIMKAHFEYEWTNSIENSRGMATTLFGVVLLWMGWDLTEIFVARIIISLGILGVAIVRAFKLEKHAIPLGGLKPTWSGLTDLLSISFFNMIQRISILLASRIDSFVIAANLDMRALAVYEIVFRIVGQINQLCNKLHESLVPVFTYLDSEPDKNKSGHFFLRVSCFINFILWMMILLIMANYPEIIDFLASGKIPFAETLPLMLVAVFIIWSNSIQWPAGNYLFATGKHKFQSYMTLASAMVNLTLSLIFVKTIGLMGVALGTLIPYLIQHQVVVIPYAIKRLNLTKRTYLLQVYGYNLIPISIYAVCLLASRYLCGWEQTNLPLMVVASGISVMVATGLWMRYSTTDQEKKAIFQKFSKLPFVSNKLLHS